MQRKYIHLLSAVAIAVVIFLTFEKLDHHSTDTKIRPAESSASVPAPPADATASKDHELKALAVELEKKPNHGPILMRMAQLDREMGKPADAVAHLRQLTKAEPENVEAHLELGRSLYETNDITGAIEETNRVLKLSPKNVDALYNMGAIYANVNKPDLARQYWTDAVTADAASDSGKRAQQALGQVGTSAGVHAGNVQHP